MNLGEIFKIINIISGDKLKGKKLSPSQAESIINLAQLKHFKEKVGVPEQYSPGMPIPKQVFENTRINSMDLQPFKVHMGKVGEVYMTVNNNGYGDVPSDMYYPSTAMYNGRRVDILSDDEWAYRYDDELTKGTERNPIANIQDTYVRFSPLKNTFVEFVYLRYPANVVFSFTQTEKFISYNESGSTELEWNEVNQIDIIYKVMFELGINIGKQEVLSVADKVKKEGV